ncbi:MAG: prepilin-type N-terminal cleavage/methylation domain-containing protein [Bacilli bacterium]|nr:prepilin-type N-terminal cleavage/methylation domain-containing protein [Bacilli bacterium]
MKKGFTLIELLAVIVILAIIAVISTPIIIGVIDNAKRSSYLDSAHGILDAANKMIMSAELNGTLANNYQIDLTTSTLNYSGKKPTSGTLLIDRIQNVSFTLKYDTYCIEKKFDESVPTIKDKTDCTIDSSEVTSSLLYKERILNGTDPIISGDLIPVIISSDGSVKKSSVNDNYYSYSDKKWANAVILLDKGISYAVGDTIPEANIESYFVWIPRYRYQLFNTSNTASTGYLSKEQTINIVFENKNTIASTGTIDGAWLTHPAFTSFNSNGMWVGKYETGYKGATSTATAQVDSSDSTKVIVKPNTYSWRSITVNNAYLASYNYNRTLDSHMMKNTEWGAVAYLSYSAYGINGNIRINNNSSYLTGYAKTEEPTCGYTSPMSTCNAWGTASNLTQPYNTETGYLASTTGNISGVYDMSGGAWEFVAGLLFNVDTPYYGSSGMSSLPASKYYDKYTVSNYSGRLLGDATGEMGPFGTWSFAGVAYSDGVTPTSGSRTISSWNQDDAYFITSGYPWFVRGGNYYYGSGAGVFVFGSGAGGVVSSFSFRLVLAP